MHDILRERILRKLEALPEAQVYQVLDYLEFLEQRYAKQQARKPDSIQLFAERLEDSMRMRNVAPAVIKGTVGALGTARRVVMGVTDAGRGIIDAALTPAERSETPMPPARTTPLRPEGPPGPSGSSGAAGHDMPPGPPGLASGD